MKKQFKKGDIVAFDKYATNIDIVEWLSENDKKLKMIVVYIDQYEEIHLKPINNVWEKVDNDNGIAVISEKWLIVVKYFAELNKKINFKYLND